MSLVHSAAQTERTVRPAKAVVRTLSVAGNSCTQCGSGEIRPSTHRNALDILLALVLLTPFRCRNCHARFYRVWRPAVRRSADASRAPLLVMPARQPIAEIDPVEPPQAAKLVPLREASSTSRRPAAILIHARDLSINKLLRRLLERRGYLVVDVSDARGTDLLIVDVEDEAAMTYTSALPDGEFARKVLVLAAGAGTPPALPERFVILQKPFALDTFVQTVDRLLQ